MKQIYIMIVLAPLLGAIVAGFWGKIIGRQGAHLITIGGVALAFVLSLVAFNQVVFHAVGSFNETLYVWLASDGLRLQIGFLVDELTVLMMVVVTFVSLMVHIYTIGYMHEDPGYQRFFSYIALFTFSMLMLVMSNNMVQLFFGWEAVGLVSYLLIGFWFNRETAIKANLKAFLVNRVGDFGFLLGIAAIALYFGSLDYVDIFRAAQDNPTQTLQISPWTGQWSVITVICILLFIGAMGKSAQFPLHVWLPDSMEGPTPISALIHAATMVTAGIFMVARMSPLFELSTTALSVVLLVGAFTALAMGLVGIVQNDIKRVVAYSTISQLGYMTAALGASAYSAAIFHLMTHAFFKALLFLGAGSVIIALHHQQDIRKMGGLYKYMPITYITMLIGSLALIGFPGFSGFFSKDAIIEAVHASQTTGAGLAYWAVLSGVFVTAFYSFRMFFLVFHGPERMDEHTRAHLHESPAVITIPLILLSIAAVVSGVAMAPLLFEGYFGQSIVIHEAHRSLLHLQAEFHGAAAFALHGFMTVPFALALSGVVLAWLFYGWKPAIPAALKAYFHRTHALLENKYGLDDLYEQGFAANARALGMLCWKRGDVQVIDGWMVNGTAQSIGRLAQGLRCGQTGVLYHYALVMVMGLAVLLGWLFVRAF